MFVMMMGMILDFNKLTHEKLNGNIIYIFFIINIYYEKLGYNKIFYKKITV